MHRLIIALTLLGLASLRASAQDGPATADDLLINCEASTAPIACTWYLKGFLDGIGANPGSASIQTVCLPDRFTLDQIRRVVVKSLTDHPEKLHLSVAQAVRDALRDAFPCKK